MKNYEDLGGCYAPPRSRSQDTQPHSLLLIMRVLLANQNRGNILNE